MVVMCICHCLMMRVCGHKLNKNLKYIAIFSINVQCIIYFRYMGAVDRSDQMVAYSTFSRRTLKWWKKVFFHVTSLSILNAWILYCVWCAAHHSKAHLQGVFRYIGHNKLTH